MFDFAVLAIGRADQADRITAVALNFEMKGERFASNGHQISTLNSNNQVTTTQCMATNEIQNGCESSIEAVLASNHKRRCVKTSGSICEQFVRQTLQRFIVPGQFRLTTGFIATPDLLRGEANLPQCDILIVAKNAPSLLKLEDSGIEVVPYESVSGIIEVKRTLTEENIWTRTRKEGALNQLVHCLVNLFKK